MMMIPTAADVADQAGPHTEAVVHDHRPVCASGSKFAAVVGRRMGVCGGGGGGYAAWSS